MGREAGEGGGGGDFTDIPIRTSQRAKGFGNQDAERSEPACVTLCMLLPSPTDCVQVTP